MQNKLKHILAQEDTVLFIGSGVSIWSGLPSWGQLIDNLSVFIESSGGNSTLVRSEAARGDLLQAASYGFAKLTKQQIGSFIKDECKYGSVRPHSIHEKIVTLGPRCFVTTNYDNLLEESLRLYHPARANRPAVTNKQLTEIAELVHARSIDFIFKPHGDAGDVDSVILTREQYRQLLPGGERSAALDAVKLLMSTRPIVYIGFGLRDPDFLYLRDLLSNTYKGAIRDHYAIMADVQDDEINYWRTSYGIHLIGYATEISEDGKRNHRPLLDLLDLLTVPDVEPEALEPPNLKGNPAAILALVRHAARLTSAKRKDPEFPICVHSISPLLKKKTDVLSLNFDHWRVEKFLDVGPTKTVLTGLPGSGKTYSIQHAAARFADKLHRYCLQDDLTAGAPPIPILVDLKLYTGDLFDLAAKTLPEHMPLEDMLKEFDFKFFIDSFNEMPREFWENGYYHVDFTRFFERIGNSSLVIGSRTPDGLQAFDLPTFDLAEISYEYVESKLKLSDTPLAGQFREEIIALLQKPFYFNLVANGSICLPEEPRPRDFYGIFFARLLEDFKTRFNSPAPLLKALSLIAYNAINRGEEAQLVSNVISILATELEPTIAEDIVNWMVAKNVLIPYSGGRIAFFHQSATEFLASIKLAELYIKDPRAIRDKVRLNRWDQSLFLTLSVLPSEASANFVQTVIDTDLELALRAVKYVEFGKDEIVSQLLDQIISKSASSTELRSNLAYLVETSLPVSNAHEKQLRKLMESGDSMGAAAAILLFNLRGEAIKEELLHEFTRRPNDFNYCHNGVATILSRIINEHDVSVLHSIISNIEIEVTDEHIDDDYIGLVSGIAKTLCRIPCSAVKNIFMSDGIPKNAPNIAVHILHNYLWENVSSESLELAAELLSHGIVEATVSVHFIGSRANREGIYLSWHPFNQSHIDFIISLIGKRHNHSWPVRALQLILSQRADLVTYALEYTPKLEPITKAIISYCCQKSSLEPIFAALKWYIEAPEHERSALPIDALDEIDISWHGHEDLLIGLIRLKDIELVEALLGYSFNLHKRIGNNLDLGDIVWWLNWMTDEASDLANMNFRYVLAPFLAMQRANDVQVRFLAEFNRSSTRYRSALLPILGERTDLSTDDLSEDAITYLLDQLEVKSEWEESSTLLGEAATERFVNERLLPLYADADVDSDLAIALRDVLSRAGSKHGRRYVASH